MKPPMKHGRLEKRVKNVVYYLRYERQFLSYPGRIDYETSEQDNSQMKGNENDKREKY
jgi:hypothetical protein